MDGSATVTLAISLPFSFDATGRVSTTNSQTKIYQDRVVLICMTLVNERVMRPTYGTRVRASAFENINAAIGMIKQEITTGFNKWLPDLTLLKVEAVIDGNNVLNANITYKYGINGAPTTVAVKTNVISQSGDIISEVPRVNR